MAEVTPQLILKDDARLAVAALLFARAGGDLFGQVTVLSEGVAVTTAELASTALAKLEEVPSDSNRYTAPFLLSFPQFLGSPGVYPLPTDVQTVDKELGFAVLSFSGQFPVPIHSGVLGTGAEPPPDTECTVLYYDPSLNGFFGVSGRTGRSQLTLDSGVDVPMTGAPVISRGLIIGFVTSRLPNSRRFVAFMSVEAMARSEVTPVVRQLMRRIEATPAGTIPANGVAPTEEFEIDPAVVELIPFETARRYRILPLSRTGDSLTLAMADPKNVFAMDDIKFMTGLNIRAVAASESSIKAGLDKAYAVNAPPPDAELFARLSSSARSGLGRAEGMRLAMRQNKLHMEHLIAGLFDSWRGFFAKAKIDQDELIAIIRRTVNTNIPLYSRAADIDKLPPLSGHVRAALMNAAQYADERRAKQIHSTHLLYGALSVSECAMVQSLNERGVRREDIRAVDGPDRAEHLEIVPLPPEGSAGDDSIRKRGLDSEVVDSLDVDSPAPVPPLQGIVPPLSKNFPGYSDLADAPGAEASPAPSVESDLWSEIDRLGYEAYARTIAKLITHRETKPPLTIGIKAPWGAGKTTLMKRVQHLLDGDADLSERNRSGTMQQGQPPQLNLRELLRELKRSVAPARLEPKPSKDGAAYGVEARTTVWFNAWKYQTSEQVWAGMAHCIISQITARMETKERELFWARLHARRVNANEVRRKVYEEIARQLLPLALVVLVICGAVIWMALAIQTSSTRYLVQGASVLFGLIGLIVKAWDKLGEKAAGTVRELIREPDYEGKMGYLHLVESDIREVLRLATPASGTPENPKENPLVVFVDDLDRCAPNKVAEVVEAINLFLCGDYPNCIFVLGMEPGMVAAALEVANKDVIEKAETMGLVDRAVPVGWRFMEKIVQLPIMIPPPTATGRQRYVNSLTGVAAKYEMQIALDAPDPNAPAPALPGAMGVGPGIMRVVTPRPPHGAEEEKKVQNYLDKLGPAKSANEAAKKGVEVVAQASPEERWAAEEAGNRLYEQALTEHDPVMAKMVEEVAWLVDGNPRQIKRYVNVFRFYSTLRQSLRLQGVIPSDDLPKDKVLAKFVALSIQWPHAVDCLRVQKELSGDGEDGKKVSLLHLLETESRKMTGDGADDTWKKFVGKEGFGMGEWAERRSFREFLARGESLCENEGHGLW